MVLPLVGEYVTAFLLKTFNIFVEGFFYPTFLNYALRSELLDLICQLIMKKIIPLLFFVVTTIHAQVRGEKIYNFLNLTGSAKQAVLGGETLTLIDNINQPLWNPATINEKLGTFHTGITYLNYGKFIGADENGEETGEFKAYDMAVSIGYAYNISNSDIYIGANLKLINSVIENYSSFGLGTDIGLSYYSENEPYIFAVVIRNLGYQVKAYDEIREDLPTQIELGASYRLENVPIRWHITFDNLQKWNIAVSNPSNETTDIDGVVTSEEITFFDTAIRYLALGAEIFPEGEFNIRVGYNFRRSKELMLIDKRTFAGFTAGFGLKMNKMKLIKHFQNITLLQMPVPLVYKLI